MIRNLTGCLLLLTLAALSGCSTESAVKQPPPPRDQIHGKALVALNETTALDAAMNAGGPSVYLIDGLNRYRLFFNKAFQIEPGKEYTAQGVYAQKAIDAIGDAGQGNNGYPPLSSCNHAVKIAWPGLAFDMTDAYVNTLREKVNRHPARAVFLVTDIEPVPSNGKDEKPPEPKDPPKLTVPADKQKALLTAGPSVLPAPLWEPTGGTARCKVVVDEEGKIAELNSGSQLCESVPWAQFRYKPTLQSGHPVRLNTEVEIRFDPHK